MEMDTRRMTKWVKTLEPQASDEMLILAKRCEYVCEGAWNYKLHTKVVLVV